MNVVVAQIAQVEDIGFNCEKIISTIEKSAEGTEIIVFPETAMTGLVKSPNNNIYHERIAEAARQKNVWVIYGGYGMCEENAFNETYVVNPLGELVHKYRKVHLWNEEGITPGREEDNIVVDTGKGKIGVITCWDIAFPESVRSLMQKDRNMEFVFCSAYWFGDQYGTTETLETLVKATAFQNECYVVLCDANAAETTRRSMIVSPMGKILELAEPTECVFSSELNAEKLRETREIFDSWKV